MAHQKLKSSNPKRRIVVTCLSCSKKLQSTPVGLLNTAAEALNACRQSGMNLEIKHGILTCPEGLILPLDDGSFVARTRIFTEFSQPDDNEDLKNELG